MACVTLTPFFNANADNCRLQGLAMACVTTVAGCGQNPCSLKYERMNFFMTSTRLSNCDALYRCITTSANRHAHRENKNGGSDENLEGGLSFYVGLKEFR